jgi:hypothetical protein
MIRDCELTPKSYQIEPTPSLILDSVIQDLEWFFPTVMGGASKHRISAGAPAWSLGANQPWFNWDIFVAESRESVVSANACTEVLHSHGEPNEHDARH